MNADVVICGAGIVGIAAAHELAVRHGVESVLLVDERAPLTLTSDKSTQAYRNWWPGPDDSILRFMNRSIDMLGRKAESSANRFLMNWPGVRPRHDGSRQGREHFAFLSRVVVAVPHARRCGWLSGQELGMHMLEQAKAVGVTILSGR